MDIDNDENEENILIPFIYKDLNYYTKDEDNNILYNNKLFYQNTSILK